MIMNKKEKDYWHSRMNSVMDENIREKEIAKIYSSQYKDIEKKILALYDKAVSGGITQRSDLYRLQHFQDVLRSIEKQNKTIKRSLQNETVKTLKTTYKEAFKTTADMLEVADGLTELNDKMLSGVLKTKWAGENWSKRIWKNTDHLSDTIKADVITSIVSGTSRDTMVKALMDDYNAGFNNADRLIRTEAAHCVNQAQLDIYKSDGIEYVEWSAGKDERMCKKCGKLHGKRFKVSEAPTLAHPRCRCTLIPVIPDDWTSDKKPKAVDKSAKSGIIKEEQLSELGKFKEKIRNDSSMSKEYYATVKKKFSHGSDFAKTAFNKFVPDDSIIDSAFEGTAKYNAKTKKISMHYGADLNNPRGACITYFHEHGHLIDDVAGNISNNKTFKDLLDIDVLNYRKSYGKFHNLKTFDKVDKAISRELNSMRKHSGVSDILDAITNGNISGVAGHDADYWNIAGRIESEAFAHMFASQFDRVRYAEMKKYFPKSLEWFENKLKEVSR